MVAAYDHDHVVILLAHAIERHNHRARRRQQLPMFELKRSSIVERPESCVLTPARGYVRIKIMAYSGLNCRVRGGTMTTAAKQFDSSMLDTWKHFYGAIAVMMLAALGSIPVRGRTVR